MSAISLDGVFTAMVTPFDASGQIDQPAVARLLAFNEAGGMDGVVVSGTNGEGASLSPIERVQLYEQASATRGRLKIIAGTATCSLPEAVYLSKQAQRAGCDALLVLPPYFFKNYTQEGLYEFYRALLESTDLPVILYHIPRITHVRIEPSLVERLLVYPNLLGVKDSEGDPETVAAYLSMAPRLRLYIGQEEGLLAALQRGAAGSISGAANVFPELVSGIFRAFSEGRDAQNYQDRLNEALAVWRKLPFPAASKLALSLRGLPFSKVRPPLSDLTSDQEETVRSFMAEFMGVTA